MNALIESIARLAPFYGTAGELREHLVQIRGEDNLQRPDFQIRRFVKAKPIQEALKANGVCLLVLPAGEILIYQQPWITLTNIINRFNRLREQAKL